MTFYTKGVPCLNIDTQLWGVQGGRGLEWGPAKASNFHPDVHTSK